MAVITWRQATKDDVGRLARFADRRGDDWTYGMYVGKDVQEDVYSCVEIEVYEPELFLICEVQDVAPISPCQKLLDGGWQFSYCPDTWFVSAEHPLGGKQSVAEVSRMRWSEKESHDMGHAIATLLNGGITAAVVRQFKCEGCGGIGGLWDAACSVCKGKGVVVSC